MLEKHEIIAIVIALISIGFVGVGIKIGWWTLDTVLSYLPEMILAGIIGILIWGFRKRWMSLFSSSDNSTKDTTINIEKKVQKILGNPRIDNGIQSYDAREDLPKFNELINDATDSVDMSALSFELLILQRSNVIKKALKKGISFTILILDIDSKHLVTYSQILENAKDLKNHINSSMEILCNLKRELKDKDNLLIKTYDSFEKYGIVIIDKDKETSLIKTEEYNLDNPNNRRNKIAYKIDNPDFYESSLDDYNQLLEKSKDYVC